MCDWSFGKLYASCMATIIMFSGMNEARADSCGKDEILPEYFDKSVDNYTDMTTITNDLDKKILSNGLGCFIGYLPESQTWHIFPVRCMIERTLPKEIAYLAPPMSIKSYLEKHSFECSEFRERAHCTRVFRYMQTPRNPATGARVNPDVQTTFVTQACFNRGQGAEITVRFFRIDKQILDTAL